MVVFEDIQDVEEWVKPMDYVSFWTAVKPYDVFDEGSRDHCDECITKRGVDQKLILSCLKTMVRLNLTEKFNLQDRIYDPVDRQYLLNSH